MHVIFSGKNTTGTEKRASVSRGKGIFKVVISKKNKYGSNNNLSRPQFTLWSFP